MWTVQSRVCATWYWACVPRPRARTPRGRRRRERRGRGWGRDRGRGAAEAAVDPVDEAPAEAASEPEPAEPWGVLSFDDEPQEAIDTEGATAESHEAPAAVYGGAATAPAAPAHEGALPLVDGAGEDPGATVAMPAMPQGVGSPAITITYLRLYRTQMSKTASASAAGIMDSIQTVGAEVPAGEE